ncbi:MAG: DUF4494 domain-containing protein [Porphyromonadaceae bacterium]|jgi:hypothetical protein|uniref:DUF4494 domain-containing protein n=1 Tax=Porphyromonas sp. TaxID=1924944 RepID=UPI001CB2F80E|nr:DUF4494 domain-containing protein [Porphyromonas sp.]MBF1289640.1 DUF4494 domain-containing protein [Porphyromonadaceae bacterium]MBF1303518.1 DUF4494 domain-containing protein [Porphyromonadaceae bacterium]MBF1308201.1 DUF4494 domain-containing protein [Porphyromonadaceae bacterium]MBF1310697.1 DUF4494 domain-containing protein [Porphyromonadaceae bacterium]MBF1316257.1 DUF4494 domain-containing protein [Porphyromonadaceae bacterium]
MNYWFECKVSYERQADSMGMKKVSESYLVDALSFTEAEKRIIKEIRPFVSVGELEVVNIRRARIAELFLNEEAEDDRYFRAKVNFITVDEKSGSEKKTSATMIVKSDSLPNAVTELKAQLDSQMASYEIAAVTDTQILDVFQYEAPEK